MFEIKSDQNSISSSQTSKIFCYNGVPPYDIKLNGPGKFDRIDTASGIYTPKNLSQKYIAIFWAKDKNNALARCEVKVDYPEKEQI